MTSPLRRLAIPDGELLVERSGPTAPADASDPRPVVLLHGFALDLSLWDPQAGPLAARHPVVRYDLRGFGASTPPVPGRSHVDDLLNLLDALDIGQAHLVGLSLGANVALGAALIAPDRVASVVLASSGLPGYEWTTPRPPDEADRFARANGIEAGRQFWLDHPFFDSARADPASLAHLTRMTAAFPGHQWGDGPQSAPLPPVRSRLAEVTAPTLVLGGAQDVAGYREIATILADEIPDARRQEFPDAGHMLNLERPEAFTAAVLEFLATVPPAD